MYVCKKQQMLQDKSKSRQDINVFTFYVDN